jgi:hypothetical protein
MLFVPVKRFKTVEELREGRPIRIRWNALNVLSFGYDAWCQRPDSERKTANQALLDDIRRTHGQVD